jgi:23S rRNA pseudouridine1911/1915/1917 synthase
MAHSQPSWRPRPKGASAGLCGLRKSVVDGIVSTVERLIEIFAQDDGPRLDKFLAKAVPDLSRSYIQKLLAAGQITVNNELPKASYSVQSGDQIVVRVPPPQPIDVQPEPIPLKIAYEDADIIVVEKPAGMVVHPSHSHNSGTLVNALLAHCRKLSGIGGALRPGIVHRLDKDTSGLIAVAKNDQAHRYLQQQFRTRHVTKAYLALVEGQVSAPSGVIDAAIGRDPRERKRMAVVRDGRDAVTEYQVLEHFAQHTLIEAHPITGRTHQIRIHCASIGHPIVGDRVYGYRKQRLPLKRHFLHAARIAFNLPSSGARLELHSELPEELERVLNTLRGERLTPP